MTRQPLESVLNELADRGVAAEAIYPNLSPPVKAGSEADPAMELARLAVTAGGNVLRGLEPGPELTTAHELSQELFGSIGVEVPDLTDFESAGADFARLHEACTAMEHIDLKPTVVFAPKLPMDGWRNLYGALEADPVANQTGLIKNGGLHIDNQVTAHWDELMDQQDNNDASTLTDHAEIKWQVAVLPTTDKAPLLSVDHNGKDGSGNISPELVNLAADLALYLPPGHEPGSAHFHPTIPAYLTLQANRLKSNQEPIDSYYGNLYYWSWLNGTLGEDRAPAGRWFPGNGRVYLTWYRVGARYDSLGARLPVWG